jgi:outer membrane receptor protein involved in Fe transport
MKSTNNRHRNAQRRPSTIRLALTTAILAALSPMVMAADAAPAPTPDPQAAPAPTPSDQNKAAKSDTQSLEGIVVTGTATAGGVKKIDASYSITAVSAEQIKQANPKSTADLLKVSPGLWPESSGGQTGANIEIAGFPGGGDAPYFTVQMNGSPLYGMPSLSFFEGTSMFRLDDTIERVELIQGGPGVVFADGQIGASANFILKQGTSTPTGSIGLTYGSEGLWRVDGFYGFPIAEGWYGSVGGFWRKSDGVRSPGFPADNGGQLTGTLTHDLDNGSIMLYARVLDDKNQFIVPIPLRQTGIGKFAAYPGFDPLTDTYFSKDIQHVHLPTYPGGGTDADLGDGRGAKVHHFGGNIDFELGGGIALSDKFLYTGGDMDTNALFSGSNPTTLGDWVTGKLAGNTGYTATLTTGGNPLAADTSVIQQGWWHIHKRMKSFNNDLRLSKEIFEGNTLTAGLYFADYSTHDKWSLGNQMLMLNKPNTTAIVVSAKDAGGTTKYLTNPQGFADFGGFHIQENASATNLAFYLSDSWRIDRWLFDASARIENEDATNHVCNNFTTTDLDGNANTLYDNSVGVCTNNFNTVKYNKTHPSYTVGVNYEVADNMAVWGRATKGVHWNNFDDLRDATGRPNDPNPLQKYQGFELGWKYQADWVFADISYYHKQFIGLPFTPSKDGNPIGGTQFFGSDSKGVNFSVLVKPFENFSVQAVGDWMDGHYSHHEGNIQFTGLDGKPFYVEINGVRLQRQPKFQVALTPSYKIPFAWGDITAFLTYKHVGNRTEDQTGLQNIGGYNTLDFGVVANYDKNWEFRVQGTNITNELGLTEANARIQGVASDLNGVILARPLEGREVNFQVKYKF